MLHVSALIFLSGCGQVIVFDPKGPVGDANRFVIMVAIALMLIVVIPVFILGFWFSFKYRAGGRALYRPNWSYSAAIDLVIWLVPIAIVTALGTLTWIETYRLDPYKPIRSSLQPVRIQAVSLDWKWLFIYPDHNIASINHCVFPTDTPLSFSLTSETVMTSFFIPQLGTQMYAMAGMETHLNLLASEAGVYLGENMQFSGRWFSKMNFRAIAASPKDFEDWVKNVRSSYNMLDRKRYEQLAEPQAGHPVIYFSPVEPGLFPAIIRRFSPAASSAGDGAAHHGRGSLSPRENN
ncbi:MAG: cytochrome bo3 quinol oxidase subunit 2 [Deltaproteobacteria bacterium]|nr:cytochrome bo3 quinol oxidase subunit 2 [Deltaproteobacteria bacterium]